MTGTLTASDVFDITPCLQQHIATLDDMSSLWCQGCNKGALRTCTALVV